VRKHPVATRLVMLVVALIASAMSMEATGQSAAPTAAAPVAKSEPLAEVTVTAQRTELAPRVSEFVNQIAVPENGGETGLSRWDAPPVCPLVSGLPQRDGEFILARLTEIAHAAAAPLGGEQCRPNLYILVTREPEDLLRGMERRNRRFTFGYDISWRTETPEGVVDEFIKTPRAVRVWYDQQVRSSDGLPLDCPTPPTPCTSFASQATRVSFNTVQTFSRVFVIVDRTQLRGVKLGQLADYVAMVALAKLKPDAYLGDVPTILQLFSGAPQAAPTSMTDWDQSFLKSLYATEQTSRLQRGEIARAMVRAIVH
jgi:hypothetical protein